MFVPKSQNLSRAWAELFLETAEGRKELSPVLITVNEFEKDGLPKEIAGIRSELDCALRTRTKVNKPLTCNNVASTIFPNSLWNLQSKDRGEHVYARYKNIFERVVKRDVRNKRGTYFQRMISYSPKNVGEEPINQLKHIIDTYHKRIRRRSGMQAAIFDPRADHTGTQYLGFPCLHQVAFTKTNKGLVVTGFYPMQYIFARAYGNYLGLCWLGRFMATQLEMPFAEMRCFINIAQLEVKHDKINRLTDSVKKLIAKT